MAEICFGDDAKALYPAVGLQSVNEETSVFIADLNDSELWQEKCTLHQTVPHTQPPTDDVQVVII